MKIIKLFPKIRQKVLERIVKALQEGKVVVCPTDTVYIPAADATNKKAVKKVFKIKKRSFRKAIPIFVQNIGMAKKLAKIDRRQDRFLKKVWPGKVTVVLKRKKSKIKLYGVDKKTIAIRIPNYKLVNILLEKLNKPLVGTSANISGKPASTRIKEVLKQFNSQKYQPDLVLDAGNLKKSRSSTVIDLTALPPKILRP